MLLQERNQLAGIQIRTSGDLNRSDVLALVGRQDGLGLRELSWEVARAALYSARQAGTQGQYAEAKASASSKRDLTCPTLD